MPPVPLKPADACRWDCVSLGEVMLRFDPGPLRVRSARQFQVWEGGGEYNVAKALRRVWGRRTAIVTALPANDVGHLVEGLVREGGVDTRHVIWRDFDGIGRNTRVGLNFTERGFGVRAPLGVSDRGHSAASQMRPGEVNWEKIFGEDGTRWFHTGGIFAALSAGTAETVLEALEAARKFGVIVSYDFNYRAALWDDHGGDEAATRVSRAIAPYVDVLIGNERDFAVRLGLGVESASRAPLDTEGFRKAVPALLKAYPNIRVVAATLRRVISASRHDWSAILYGDGAFHQPVLRENLEVYDRVGSGDGFAAGIVEAYLADQGPQAAVDQGAALGALVMTTPGDTAMADAAEVDAVAKGADARITR